MSSNKNIKNQNQRKVCIIGAGASGLVTIRHVSETEGLEGVVFELSGDLGGIWNYTENIGTPGNSHSTAYKGLRTNLPRHIMGYLDHEFEKTGNSFMMHDEVLQFLRGYALKYQLENKIQYNTKVLSVKPVFQGEKSQTGTDRDPVTSDLFFDWLKWQVTFQHQHEQQEIKTELFDAVIICNGHFSKPVIPEIPNLSLFSGKVIHSRDYKIPEPFGGKRVLIVGSGPSGIDIMLEINQLAEQVTLSMKNPPYPGKLPEEIHQVGVIKEVVSSTQVRFSDGIIGHFDIILLCTGYEYSQPFLDDDCGLEVQKGKFLFPLYRHMVNVNYPTMALIGLQFRVCPFMLFDAQVRNYVTFLCGLKYPSKADMLEEIQGEIDYRSLKGIPHSRSHQLEELQWPYFQTLGAEGGFQAPKPVIRKIYEKVAQRRGDFPMVYKNDEIRIVDDGNFLIDETI